MRHLPEWAFRAIWLVVGMVSVCALDFAGFLSPPRSGHNYLGDQGCREFNEVCFACPNVDVGIELPVVFQFVRGDSSLFKDRKRLLLLFWGFEVSLRQGPVRKPFKAKSVLLKASHDGARIKHP